MKKKKNEIKLFCEFVIPPMLIWASIVVIPLIYGIYLTFTNWNGLSPNYDLVGFSNYAAIFTDKTFLSSLWKTFVYVFFVVVFSNVLGLALALLLTYGIKLQGLFRTCFFAANMIGGVVMGYIWNYSLIIVAVWQLSGYLMVIYVAGLTNVSKDMLEAAKIDGANSRQLLRFIKIPMIRSSITICVFMAISRAFMSFDVNLTLTAGGPFKSTELLALKIYQTAFSNFDYGKGQAEALVLFVIVAIISLVQVSVSKKGEVQA